MTGKSSLCCGDQAGSQHQSRDVLRIGPCANLHTQALRDTNTGHRPMTGDFARLSDSGLRFNHTGPS